MGMYDYVDCRVPLPDARPTPPCLFQTKDLSCELEKFTINDDGRLIHHSVRYEEVPKAERPYPNDDGILGFCGAIKSIPTGDVDLNFHGVLEFYDYNVDTKEWREFNAKFTDGKLVEITSVCDTGDADG